MGHTHKKGLEEQCASIPNRAWKSMIDGGLGPRAPCSPMNGGGVIPRITQSFSSLRLASVADKGH